MDAMNCRQRKLEACRIQPDMKIINRSLQLIFCCPWFLVYEEILWSLANSLYLVGFSMQPTLSVYYCGTMTKSNLSLLCLSNTIENDLLARKILDAQILL